MPGNEDLRICCGCGTQFDVPASKPLSNCRICDDPREFILPQGQTWTSLGEMAGKYENKWEQDEQDDRMWSIWTEPKFAIGQRAVLLQTPHGNVLWDCITYLDDATVDFIKAKGGLKAIVISHPHYYTTHVDWAEAFDCPVYMAIEDEEWLNRPAPEGRRTLLKDVRSAIVPEVTAIKVGGHFPGSLVLHWEKKLMIADTFVTAPSALYHVSRLPGTTSYSFMWSIPNMIPLSPDVIYSMWLAVKEIDFESTYGAFVGTDVRDKRLKGRVLESMKIQSRFETGSEDHKIMKESLG